MPITPFHMGPGLAVKAAAGRRFSLMVFGFSQVAIDIEPLVGLIRGSAVLHGFSHTFVGATLIGLVSAVVGRPVCQWLLRWWPAIPEVPLVARLRGPARISWPAAVTGAFVGTYSHIVLDGMMHLDMHPWAPFSQRNPLLGTLSVVELYLFCVAAGVAGAGALAARYHLLVRASERTDPTPAAGQ